MGQWVNVNEARGLIALTSRCQKPSPSPQVIATIKVGAAQKEVDVLAKHMARGSVEITKVQ